eukprot:m.223845 g.223845  ORF g.223845 m.223845 type:complete len:79 (-) comp10827_c0_seq16:3868-4104(-)
MIGQLAWRAKLNQSSMVHDHNFVGINDRMEAMRDGDHLPSNQGSQLVPSSDDKGPSLPSPFFPHKPCSRQTCLEWCAE